MGVEEALQYQHGSHLIDHRAVAGKGAPGGVQVAMGLGRGQPFVPQVYGQGEGFAQRVGKGMGFCGLGADVARHVERIAQHDGRAAVFAEKAAEGFQVRLQVFAEESEDRLRREPQLIGNGNADTAITEIKAKQAGRHSRMVARGTRQAEGKIGILQ